MDRRSYRAADQLEQDAGLGLILGDVGEVVEDQQVVVVELGDGAFERELAARDLQPLHEVGRAGEEHAPAVLDEGEADGGREMALSAAGRPEQQQLAPFSSQASPAASAMIWALREHRHGLEVEGVEGLARRQARFGEVAFDAAAAAFGELVLGERGEEAGGGPALLVGLLGELGPDRLMVGRRSSLSSSSRRAASTVSVAVMLRPRCRFRQAGCRQQQLVVGAERRQLDDDIGHGAVRAAKRIRSAARSGNRPASRSASIRIGQLGLAGALVGERQQADHERQAWRSRQCSQQRFEGPAHRLGAGTAGRGRPG